MFKRPAAFLISALICSFFISTAAAQQSTTLVERINKRTVSIISGGVDGTYIRIASDLAAVLDNGYNLRVLPIIGKGSFQNIYDMLYLRGIDIGIVQSDILAYFERENLYPNIKQKIHYITKLYNEEFHLLAGEGIGRIQELSGKKVNFGIRGSGTYLTTSVVFDTLNIDVKPVSFDQAMALEKVKTGEIAAMVYLAGKPTRLFRDIRIEDGVHFLSIPAGSPLFLTYVPSFLTNEDYPGLVLPGEQVITVAVEAMLAVYNWKQDTTRYRKVSRFVCAFFNRFEEFLKPPRHPKWKEVNLAAKAIGWTRFRAADDCLR